MTSPYLKRLLDDGKYDEVVYTYVTHNPTVRASATGILKHLNCRFIKGSEGIIIGIHKGFVRLWQKGIVIRVGNRAYKYNPYGDRDASKKII